MSDLSPKERMKMDLKQKLIALAREAIGFASLQRAMSKMCLDDVCRTTRIRISQVFSRECA